jgi:Family of unknown function (DUF5755)
MKKCPPGVICVENITLFLITIIILVLGFLFYINLKDKTKETTINVSTREEASIPSRGFFSFLPSWPYNNIPKDVLLDPYSPPYRDERYLVPELIVPKRVPINVSTNIGAVDTQYRQMGILTPLNGASKDNILPLMGRPLFTNRDKWQYYTISNQHNNVKLPISFKGRSALNDYGVDQIFSGDTVYVEGYNDAFKTTVYENDTIKYLPFI